MTLYDGQGKAHRNIENVKEIIKFICLFLISTKSVKKKMQRVVQRPVLEFLEFGNKKEAAYSASNFTKIQTVL